MMAKNDRGKTWDSGTWEGSRRAQLRASLKLSHEQRYRALEDLDATAEWLAAAGKTKSAQSAAVSEDAARYKDGRHEIVLEGCSPTPLASYLKALAILRLVAEQKDPEARGWWQGEHFVLRSSLDRAELARFFLDEYRPTPIIAPWNGGSGFFYREEKIKDPTTRKNIKTGRRNQVTTATKTIDKLLTSKSARLENLRGCARMAKEVLLVMGLDESPKERPVKFELLSRLRAALPEEALSSLDAAISISSDDLLFPPLLGTGGTDGNLDFTNNFIQRVLDVLDDRSKDKQRLSTVLLNESLEGTLSTGMARDAIGQFSPGQSGGPNSGTGFEADAVMNPWEFVLMIEGALLFAASTTRRYEGDTGSLSFPFTVRPVAAGSGAAAIGDEAPSRAEIWLPIWSNPAGIREIGSLLSEGRVTIQGRQAKDGLDFSRAISRLAINRGIEAFERYAFLKRSGKAYLASPFGRFNVPRQAGSDLIAELETEYWLGSFQSYARNEEAPARVRALAQRLNDALFELARRRSDRSLAVQSVLTILGEAHRYASSSKAWREKLKIPPPLSGKWVTEANDGSTAIRIAAAVAGLYSGDLTHPMPLRAHIAPETEKNPAWTKGAHVLDGWSGAELVRDLVAVLHNRLLRSRQWGLSDKPLAGGFGCDLDSAARFLRSPRDDRRIAGLAAGLSLCRIPDNAVLGWGNNAGVPIPAGYGLLKLLFTPDAQLARAGLIGKHDRMPVPLKVLRLLQAGRMEDAIIEAHRRLRIGGLGNLPLPGAYGLDPARLAAALLIPLTDDALRQIARALRLENPQQLAS